MAERKVTVHDPIHPKAIERNIPLPGEPQIDTMNRKVVIDACVPGWHPVKWWRERGVDHLPPTTIEGQVDAIVECVKAGASVIHIHPRDPNKDGFPQIHATELMAEIVDRAMEQVDFITCPHTWAWDFEKSRAPDYASYTDELLKRGKGNKYCQAALVMTMGAFSENNVVFTNKATAEGVQWLEANGVKPMYSLQAYSFRHYKELLFDTGIAKWDPPWFSLQMGKHNDDQCFADPWSYLQVINNVSLVRSALPNAFIGMHPGGRNWLPIATVGMLYGVELFRVGLEDQFYLWPHRDEISTKASTTVEMIGTLAKTLGREVATAQDVRDRLNMKFTSPR